MKDVPYGFEEQGRRFVLASPTAMPLAPWSSANGRRAGNWRGRADCRRWVACSCRCLARVSYCAWLAAVQSRWACAAP